MGQVRKESGFIDHNGLRDELYRKLRDIDLVVDIEPKKEFLLGNYRADVYVEATMPTGKFQHNGGFNTNQPTLSVFNELETRTVAFDVKTVFDKNKQHHLNQYRGYKEFCDCVVWVIDGGRGFMVPDSYYEQPHEHLYEIGGTVYKYRTGLFKQDYKTPEVSFLPRSF